MSSNLHHEALADRGPPARGDRAYALAGRASSNAARVAAMSASVWASDGYILAPGITNTPRRISSSPRRLARAPSAWRKSRSLRMGKAGSMKRGWAIGPSPGACNGTRCRRATAAKLGPDLGEPLVDAGLTELTEGGHAGGAGDRVAAQRSAQQRVVERALA